jgi:hypothetical protein
MRLRLGVAQFPQPVIEGKVTLYVWRCLICGDEQGGAALPRHAAGGGVWNLCGFATVQSMKISQEDSDAISSFIFMSKSTEMVVLEVIEQD